VYLGETNPEEGIPVDYMISEELLKEIKNGELFGRSPFTSSHLVAQKLPIYSPSYRFCLTDRSGVLNTENTKDTVLMDGETGN
jgi:hypothetical protein